jgi:hypothetical protein
VNFCWDFHRNCVLFKILSWDIFLSMRIVQLMGTHLYVLCVCMSNFYNSTKPSFAHIAHETYLCEFNPSIPLYLCKACSMELARCSTLPHSQSLSQYWYFHYFQPHFSDRYSIGILCNLFCFSVQLRWERQIHIQYMWLHFYKIGNTEEEDILK